MPVDDVVGNLPFIVRGDHRIMAAFASKVSAENWARVKIVLGRKPLYRAYRSELRCIPQSLVLVVYQDGEGDACGKPTPDPTIEFHSSILAARHPIEMRIADANASDAVVVPMGAAQRAC